MIDQNLSIFIYWLQGYPAEIASLLTFIVCAISILGACRFGYGALCAYNALAIVVANIQVLRLGSYFSTPESVALGTVLFATTYLVSDIITEHYGVKAARQAMIIGFTAQLLTTCWMVLCLAHPGVAYTSGITTELVKEQENIFKSIWLIFMPSARFFVASILSYVATQLIDISLYQWIREKTNNRYLWLRQNVSLFISGFLDNMLFSILAWIVLSPTPLSLRTVIITYVLAGCIVRIVVNVMGTPILYWSYRFVHK
ncbi:MAG: queuosine precursor transporter [Candidatus Paracaedibacteraceae bacterium]|nr:queuosine precursor transporter [Candidatus Paracaedibacteraceae bacterium]